MLRFLKSPIQTHVTPAGALLPTAFHRTIRCGDNIAYYSTGEPVGKVHADGETWITQNEHMAAVKCLEAECYRRYEEEKAKYNKTLQEGLETRVLKFGQHSQDMEKNSKQLHEQKDEELRLMREEEEQAEKRIEELVMENRVLKDSLQKAKACRMTLRGNLSACGALEHLAKRKQGEKSVRPTVTIQESLNELSKRGKFVKTLKKEAVRRKLRLKDVEFCANHLYAVVAIRVGRDDDMVVVIEGVNFSDDELASLTVFLKVQDNWPHALVWKVRAL